MAVYKDGSVYECAANDIIMQCKIANEYLKVEKAANILVDDEQMDG